jgi:hypothetical protein
VIVTGYTNARIAWPKGRLAESRGQPSLIVDDELFRALHNESRIAVAYWWGLCKSTVTMWRIRLGVQRFNPGSKRLQVMNSAKGADATRGVKLPGAAVERRRRTALELAYGPQVAMAVQGHGRPKSWLCSAKCLTMCLPRSWVER